MVLMAQQILVVVEAVAAMRLHRLDQMVAMVALES
jgi:hypothetical protein